MLLDRLVIPAEPFDIAWTPGWAPDYTDPYAFINVLLHGDSNLSRFDLPRFNRRMDRAARLSGAARYRAYGELDVALARVAAPLVAYGFGYTRTLVSNRLDPRCRILRPGLDLAAVCLKRS